MSVIFHFMLPIWIWVMVYNRPFILNNHGVWLINGFMLLIGIIGSLPDTLPLINSRYKIIDNLYLRIHQPWQFGHWWMYILWAVFWPAGLHCLCDIPVHRPDGELKNAWADVLVELLLLIAIIATRGIWYVRI